MENVISLQAIETIENNVAAMAGSVASLGCDGDSELEQSV